jgi:predicted Zn-dependent peptidase
MTITIHVAPGVNPQKILAMVRREVKDLGTTVSPSELKRVRERILSSFSFERDGVFNEIRAVSEAVAAGDWKLAYSIEEATRKLAPKDLVKAAKKYLVPRYETSGVLTEPNP